MIINKVTIENFLCYFGCKEFELNNGLNIVLGENGEGKTKFFEAIEWLFSGSDKDLNLLVSAKALSQAEIGQGFNVSVSVTLEQYNETKIIIKSFRVTKKSQSDFDITNYNLKGIDENRLGERMPVDGSNLLNRVFPFQIRRYSMFKGESALDIFSSKDALKNLINLFSDAKYYEIYAEKGALLREKAEKAVEDSTKKDKKNEDLYKRLGAEILDLKHQKQNATNLLNIEEGEIGRIEESIQDVEEHINNAEDLQTINNRIHNLEEKIRDHNARIDENYTNALFDEKWIVVNFEPTHKKFANKITEFGKNKRTLQTEFDKQKGIEEGKEKAKAELLNNKIPLPVGVPSRAHMEEMIKDEICKVCNRPAENGSDAYEFMLKRLEDYLSSQEVQNRPEEETILFNHDYLKRLESLCVNHEDNLKNLRKIKEEIKDWFEFNDKIKSEVRDLNAQLEKEKEERNRVLGNSKIAAEKLGNVLKNYNTWQKDLTERNKQKGLFELKINQIEEKLLAKQNEKDAIDLESANSFHVKTREVLRDIEAIFLETKEKKFNEFVSKLEEKSNQIFQQVNVNSFTGTIVFLRKKIGSEHFIDIELQEGGRKLYKPNQSLETSMHISVLFAISELASEVKEERYPMIFDAPTSSFGENKTTEFLNLIYSTDGQKILLIKDFLKTNPQTNNLEVKKEFQNVKRDKAFWVRLIRPFDKNDLRTIDSEVINI